MKLPYQAGDSFALPLGDGSYVRAQIVACGHHTVDLAVEGLEAIRASDRALVLHRWRGFGRATPEFTHRAGNAFWKGPAHVERLIATQLGVAALELPPLFVHEGRFTPSYPCARNDEELRVLATRDVRSLVVAGPVTVHAIASLFPHLRGLRISVRDFRIDARHLAACTSLEVLDCSSAAIEHPGALAALPRLRALRLARMPRFDVRALNGVRVEALSFESIADLHGVPLLAQRDELRQLELLDLWPCELGDVMPLVETPNLVRAYVDIGGRRKNVELNRRANWAYPWPLELYLQLA